MADKMIGELPAGLAIDNDTLFVSEQQGQAVKITGKEFRKLIGTSGDGSSGDYTAGGYVEMTESIPVSERKPNTLYGLVLKTYS